MQAVKLLVLKEGQVIRRHFCRRHLGNPDNHNLIRFGSHQVTLPQLLISDPKTQQLQASVGWLVTRTPVWLTLALQ